MVTHQVELRGVVLITGVMAAGKSTVAEQLARRSPRGVHVRGDVFRRFIVSGRQEPNAPLTAAAWEQLLLRYRLAAAAADTYAREGFFVVLQDVIVGPVLAEVAAMLQTRPRYVVVLDPNEATVRAREAARDKIGYGEGWDAAALVEALRTSTPRIGAWLDTAQQTPADTVDTVIQRLDDALVPDGPSRA